VDCRVDGSAQCLRLLQEELRQRKWAAATMTTSTTTTTRTITTAAVAAAAVTIKSVPCIGPCGDGPNVVVVDATTGKRIVDPDLAQRKEGPMSLAPADMFGVNTAGVYQVRNAAMANAVMNLAIASNGTAVSTATTTPGGGGGGRGGGGASFLSEPAVRGQSDNSENGIVVSNRNWWDRPRNERIFLQRCMHASILVGIADRYGTTTAAGTSSSGEAQLDALGWSMAAFLWLLSNFIMKESLLEQVLTGKAWTNHRKKRR
jgi:hypothetical protein